MRNRVEKLRIWLVAGSMLLLLVLAAYVGWARYRTHHFLTNLPKRLGIDIKSETNGYTYSQSVQGKTVYTVHAAKAIEHTDGKIALHDVSIALYGRKDTGQSGDAGADRIFGDEFEYDQPAGVVRAIGIVHIDLQAPAGEAGPSGKSAKVPQDPRVLHATTSGLVFLQKLGVAATQEYIEFQLGEMKGHATGADYNTDSGLLVLHSAVNVTGLAGGRPVVLTASRAQLDQKGQIAFLDHARYVSLGNMIQADHATVHTRPDGSPERIEAEGNVTSSADGATLTAQRADVVINTASKPELVKLQGSLHYVVDDPLRQGRGQADAGTIRFDAEGQPEHATFTGGVHMVERTRATDAPREPWSVRDLTGGRVEATFSRGTAGKALMRDAEAVGGARLTSINNGSLKGGPGDGRMEVSADDLKAHFVQVTGLKSSSQVESITGQGHTLIRQLNAAGIEQTSAGDALDARFRLGAQAAAGKATDTLQSSMQQGHVVMVRKTPASPGVAGKKAVAADEQRATAEKAAYDGDADRLLLSGGAALTDQGSLVRADRIAFDRATGDANAEGAVRVTYQQADQRHAMGDPTTPGVGAEPVHVLAARAELKRDSETAIFYAAPGKPVRLWQAASQVEAPVIEFDRDEGRMTAHGEASAKDPLAPQVHTTLLQAGSTKVGAVARPAQVIRVTSRGMTYSDESRQVGFTGGVRVVDADGSMLSKEATVFLKGVEPKGAKTISADVAQTSSFAGNVDHVVATGNIQIDQPGRHATGERVVYTSSDGLFLLTGTPEALPKLVDAEQGAITGASMSFHSGDESVLVTGADPTAPSRRVRTDTHTK